MIIIIIILLGFYFLDPIKLFHSFISSTTLLAILPQLDIHSLMLSLCVCESLLHRTSVNCNPSQVKSVIIKSEFVEQKFNWLTDLMRFIHWLANLPYAIFISFFQLKINRKGDLLVGCNKIRLTYHHCKDRDIHSLNSTLVKIGGNFLFKNSQAIDDDEWW